MCDNIQNEKNQLSSEISRLENQYKGYTILSKDLKEKIRKNLSAIGKNITAAYDSYNENYSSDYSKIRGKIIRDTAYNIVGIINRLNVIIQEVDAEAGRINASINSKQQQLYYLSNMESN